MFSRLGGIEKKVKVKGAIKKGNLKSKNQKCFFNSHNSPLIGDCP
jgi:hypothetical protein